MRVGEFGDLSRRPAYTATNVKNLHTSLDSDLHREIVLVTRNGLIEGLANRVPAEVEALSPTILVQVGREVVITTRKSWSVVHQQYHYMLRRLTAS